MGKNKDKKKDKDTNGLLALANYLKDAADKMSALTEFSGMHEGYKLLAELEAGITPDRKRPNITPQPGENPLYEFRTGKDKFNYYEIPILQKVFDLLSGNNYGLHTYVGKYDNDATEFRRNLESRNPSWISELPMEKFSKLVYFYGSTGGGTNFHGNAERICDGTIQAMLKRAMILGRYRKPEPAQQQQAASAPTDPQIR